MKEENISLEKMAEILGLDFEEFVALLLAEGFIDEKGRPTEYALINGLLVEQEGPN